MRKLVTVLALAGAVSLLVVTAAAGERPAFNPSCEGTKIEPVETGTYPLLFGGEAGSVTITVAESEAGPVFEFVTDSSGHLVTSIVVKGGPEFATFTPNASSGSGLHAPLNPDSGDWYGLSHLCLATALDAGRE